MTTSAFSRRTFLSTTTAALTATAASLHQRLFAAAAASGLKGRIQHSVCKWCYPKIGLQELCVAGKEMGLTSVELLQPSDFPILKDHGFICALCAMTSNPSIKDPNGKMLGGIERAWYRKEHHDLLVQAYEPQIVAVSGAGFRNLICLSGNRAGLDDEAGLKNCAVGLKKILSLAEKRGVVFCMELLAA